MELLVIATLRLVRPAQVCTCDRVSVQEKSGECHWWEKMVSQSKKKDVGKRGGLREGDGGCGLECWFWISVLEGDVEGDR